MIKIFKIILIFLLLVSINFSICGMDNQPLTQGEISDWQKSYGEIGKSQEEPDTLLEWFKDLTLDEKVEIYNHWQKKNTHYVIYQRKNSDSWGGQ